MSTVNIPDASSGDLNTDEIECILANYDSFIVTLARQVVARAHTPPDVLDMEIDEIAQMTRIKLWKTLRKTHVDNLRAYIRRIAHNEAINRLRQRKDVLPLPVDEHNEMTQEFNPLTQGEITHDPVHLYEQKEALAEQMRKLVALVMHLPQRQQQAMLCSLKERTDDLHALTRGFKLAGKDIEAIRWPYDKTDENRLRASLSFTRKRLRPHFEVA
ncbi:RNA polymerase sigma factor [Ktedonospora formicarum]|uniref:RNA polymerase sigma-70 region 2 domain-containing protein n=1 Tax=Ktedonospora formicarum TaxID=2778364 RepID=A0A8J3I2E6_9CHLR|nr:sigma-70 family RNA polymerase sigma factor [Ktedonospora formicarum]GHO44992.1 hypothetical protein KSX_31550 [Ktedonospora formicarum]